MTACRNQGSGAAHRKEVRRRNGCWSADIRLLARNPGVQELTQRGFAELPEEVYCFLSRRGGDSEELVTAGGQNPQTKTKSGRAFEDRRRGGDDLPADENPGTRICIGVAGRVSLKSCSGAILNVGLGGVGCVCCLRTQ